MAFNSSLAGTPAGADSVWTPNGGSATTGAYGSAKGAGVFGSPQWANYTTDLWQSGAAPTYMERGSEGDPVSAGYTYDQRLYNPDDIKSMGYEGPVEQMMHSDGKTPWGDNNGFNGGADDYQTSGGFDPQFQKYMQDNGYSSLQGSGESGNRQQFLHNGQLFGMGQTAGDSSNDAFGIAMLLAGGLVGGSIAGGAGAAAEGGSAATLEGGAYPAGAFTAEGATNPALIESAVGTPGYGASSVGAGGGAGQFSLGSTLKDLYQGYQKYNQVNQLLGGGRQGGSAGAGVFSGSVGSGLSAGDRYRQRLAAQSLRDMSQQQAVQPMPGWIPGG